MRVKCDGEWVTVHGKRIYNGNPPEWMAQVRSMQERVRALKEQITLVSHELAPLTATTPTLKKYYSKSGSGYATQGGCVDGTYLYFYIRASDETESGTLIKLKLSDYSEVKTASISLYHGNDMTYCPDDGLLYVATMYSSGDTSRVDVVDPDTLAKVKSIYAPMYISAIAYEPTRRVFVGASGGSLNKYLLRLNDAGEFEHVGDVRESESPSMSSDDWTSQGIACDGGFIYHCWSNSPNMRIEVFSWLGEYMGTISKSIKYSDNSAEIEFVDKLSRNGFIIGAYVSGYHGAAPIYTFTAT